MKHDVVWLLRCKVWLIASAIAVACFAPESSRAADPAASPRKAVLVLSGERSNLPSIAAFERAMRESLAGPDAAFDLFVEHLDSGRFSGPRHQQEFARHLANRYAGMRIDAVVTVTESALDFALANRARLFPGVPLVGAQVDKKSLQDRTLPADVAVIPYSYDYRSTIELMRALMPGLQQVVVVSGVAEYDLRRRDEARNAIASFTPALEFTALSGISMKSIEEAVRGLPPDSAVLMTSMVRDAEARSYVGKDVVARLVAVSPVPVFGTFESHLEAGALGAAITSNSDLGRLAAAEVTRALAKKPFETRLPEQASAPLHVNWRALQHWKLPEKLVPAGAVIDFRPPTLWAQHRALISVIAAALLLQAICISVLLFELRRRRAIERNLQESELRFRTMADTAPIMISISGPDAKVSFVNETYLHFTGRKFEQEVGQSCGLGIHPEDLDGYIEAHVAAYAERREFLAEYRLRRNDGAYRWIAERGVPRFAPGGTFVGYISSCIDFTERKRLNEKFRLAAAALPTGIIMFNEQGSIVLANAQAEMLFGYERGELLKCMVGALLPDRALDAPISSHAQLIGADTAGQAARNREVIARRKDGSEFSVEMALTPVDSEEGKFVLASIADVTERQELQRSRHELAHVARVSVMGQLAGSLAHELNQPLTAILSNTQAALRFMNRESIDVAEVRETLNDVVDEGKRASEIIRHMRALVKKAPLEVAPVELPGVMREVAKLMHSDAVMRGMNMRFEIAPDLPVVHGDRIQLQQVMLNLLLNAFEAMKGRPYNERIATVVLAREGNTEVRIEVQDRGTGLTSDALERIFKPFFTTSSEGLGLGLSICHSIIEAHGGRLRAESSHQAGARFYFTLPVAGAAAQSSPAVKAA